jgi:transcriptional regulator with XRE-family HTH domain
MTERRVTLSEAAQILGVHRNTVSNWVLAGRLPSAEKLAEGDSVERWTVAEDEILEIRRDRPRGRTLEGGSLGDEVWVIHDLAIRLADAEARAARAEARLEELRKNPPTRTPDPTARKDTDGG